MRRKKDGRDWIDAVSEMARTAAYLMLLAVGLYQAAVVADNPLSAPVRCVYILAAFVIAFAVEKLAKLSNDDQP